MKKILKFLKRPFCKHTYKICTFPLELLGEHIEAPCTDVRGYSLCECQKCGKQKVIITF